MKEPYRWKYNIKIRTKDGEYVYEDEVLERLEKLLDKHPNYEEVQAQHVKKLEKKRNRAGGTRLIDGGRKGNSGI